MKIKIIYILNFFIVITYSKLPWLTICGQFYCINNTIWKINGATNYGATIDNIIKLAKEENLNTIRIVNFLDESSTNITGSAYDEKSWIKVDETINALSNQVN